MFLVGGGILVHGVAPLHEAILHAVQPLGDFAQSVLPMLANAMVGVVAGGVVLLAVRGVQRLRH